MDFTPAGDTKEMVPFRKEVRAWLEANVTEEMKDPVDPDERREERFAFWREKYKELGTKGWLAPTLPKKYGGGGLAAEHEGVIADEFSRFHAPLATVGGVCNAILVWGTEEQKNRFLPPLLTGQKFGWLKLTEPKSGADLASYQSRAVKDGDDWIVNGSNVFITGRGTPDWIWGPLLTDPEAPRHRNLGFFMIPFRSEGLQSVRMKLVAAETAGDQHFIFMENVRVPNDNLIGEDHQGWQVAQTVLEGGGALASRQELEVESLVRYLQDKRRVGEGVGDDPVRQQTAVEVYIDDHVSSLFNRRARWMYHNRMEMSWQHPLGDVFNRESGLRKMRRIRDIMSMDTLISGQDPRAWDGGRQEVLQRGAFVLQHGHGTLNIAKVILARRIGISRTKERAAPTPMSVAGVAS